MEGSDMTTVIAAIDNSAAARPVLLGARALAHVLGSEVEAFHVAEDEGQTARACAESFGIPCRQVAGDPLRQVTARACGQDVVAVAIGARRGPRQRRVGHLAREVANAIDKPVLVVPPEAMPPEQFRTVLIAIKGTPAHARTLKGVIDVVAGADLDLVVLHVDDEASIPSFSDQAAYETEAYATEFLARYVYGAPKARFEPRIGVPADEIVMATEAIAADLIALGWPQSTDERRGQVAREVLDRSHLPVLLVALGDTPTR